MRPAFAPGFARAEQHRRGAVDDARRIAGVMDMDDALDLRMRLDGDRVEAALLAHHDERRLQRGERLHVGLRPHVLVMIEQGEAVDVEDRRDRILEAAVLPGRGGALLRLDRVGVDVVAREAVFGRDQIGRDALRHEIGGNGERRIDRPGAARGADADAAHRFDAAADRQIVLAGHDLRGGEIDPVEAGGAEAVDLHARHLSPKPAASAPMRAMSPPASPTGSTQPITTSSTSSRIEMVAILDRLQRGRGQMQRRRRMQRAVRLAAPARRADVIVDEGLGHSQFSLPREPQRGVQVS